MNVQQQERDALARKIGPLTVEDAQWLLANIKSPLVKCSPRGRSGCDMNHFGRAMLLSVNPSKQTAIIKPSGHKKTEEVELKYLHKWNSKYSDENLAKRDHQFATEATPLTVPIRAHVVPPQIKPMLLVSVGKKIEEIPHLVIAKPVEPVMPKAEEKEEKRQYRTYSQKDADEIRALIDAGKTQKEIQSILGIPVTSQAHLRNKYPADPARLAAVIEKICETPVDKIAEIQPPAPVQEEIAAKIPTFVAPAPVAHLSQFNPSPAPHSHDRAPAILEAIRGIMKAPISDTAKLLAIEGMIS